MTKQLTQQQIDSLNAIYAKMEDDSLELEFFTSGEWDYSSDTGNNVESRTQNIMMCNTPYRIKPKAPKKEYYVVEAAELPVPTQKLSKRNYDGEFHKIICEVKVKDMLDADVWYKFFYRLSDSKNIITK